MSGLNSKRLINFTNRVLFYDPAHFTVEAPLYIDDRQADARVIWGAQIYLVKTRFTLDLDGIQGICSVFCGNNETLAIECYRNLV